MALPSRHTMFTRCASVAGNSSTLALSPTSATPWTPLLFNSLTSLLGSLSSSTTLRSPSATLGGGLALPVPSAVGGLAGLFPVPAGLSEEAEGTKQGAVEATQSPIPLWDEFVMRMNRNKRRPKAPNNGARPCSSVGRSSRKPYYKGNPYGHTKQIVKKTWPKGPNNRRNLKLARLGIEKHRSYNTRMKPKKQRKTRERRPSQSPTAVAERARARTTGHTGTGSPASKKRKDGLWM